MVAVLERAGKRLVRVAFELVRALRPLDLGADALLLGRGEAPGAHHLTLVDVLGRNVARNLLGARDRPGDDCLAQNRLLLQELLIDDIRAGRAGRDVARRDEDGDFVLTVLHVTLVVHDVDARQDGG